MSQNDVGFDDLVRTVRLLLSIHDNAMPNEKYKRVSSGSICKVMNITPKSNLDVMCILRLSTYQNQAKMFVFNSFLLSFAVNTNDEKPGFAHMRLLKHINFRILNSCKNFKRGVYLSDI